LFGVVVRQSVGYCKEIIRAVPRRYHQRRPLCSALPQDGLYPHSPQQAAALPTSLPPYPPVPPPKPPPPTAGTAPTGTAPPASPPRTSREEAGKLSSTTAGTAENMEALESVLRDAETQRLPSSTTHAKSAPWRPKDGSRAEAVSHRVPASRSLARSLYGLGRTRGRRSRGFHTRRRVRTQTAADRCDKLATDQAPSCVADSARQTEPTFGNQYTHKVPRTWRPLGLCPTLRDTRLDSPPYSQLS
jgi:hypothetical protein